MHHTSERRSIPHCTPLVALLSIGGLFVATATAAATGATTAPTAPTAPATQASTRPTTRPVLPRIFVRSLGLMGEVIITVTPDGIYSYSNRDHFAEAKTVTHPLKPAQIARLAKAVQETLDRPSRPEEVTDHYEKVTIGEQTWESHDIDSKFQPLFRALYELAPNG